MVARGWGRGDEELLFNGYRVSIWQDEKVLEISLHNNEHIGNITELYTLKWSRR